MMIENLWNVSDGKTRSVIQYVERIPVPDDPGSFEKARRISVLKEEALKCLTANGMLEKVGYRFGKYPSSLDGGL